MLSYLAFVYGHVDAIKACVRPWKDFDILVTVNSELSDVPVIALKKRKTERNRLKNGFYDF